MYPHVHAVLASDKNMARTKNITPQAATGLKKLKLKPSQSSKGKGVSDPSLRKNKQSIIVILIIKWMHYISDPCRMRCNPDLM